MDAKEFSKFSEKIKDEVESGDYIHEQMSKVPRIRIHQDRTQNPPENSKVGYFYSPNAGFIVPAPSMIVTILETAKIRLLWTPFTQRDKHLICHCFDQDLGYGILYEERDERWLPGEGEDAQRQCLACVYNRFRNRAFPIGSLFRNGEKEWSPDAVECRSGQLFAGFMLPEDSKEELTIDTVIPFYFQATSSLFAGSYTSLPNSWETFSMACKLAKPVEIPIRACKIEFKTTTVDMANGPTIVPTFNLVGVHHGFMPQVRAIASTYKEQLALKGSMQPITYEENEVEPEPDDVEE